jgi:hypothetical protein
VPLADRPGHPRPAVSTISMRKRDIVFLLLFLAAAWPAAVAAGQNPGPLASAGQAAPGLLAPRAGQAPQMQGQAQTQKPPEVPAPAQSQASGQAAPVTVCGLPVPPPVALPPAGSPPVVYLVMPACFPTQGNVSVIESDTYRYYVQLQPSKPSAGTWVPWDEKAEQTALEDFKRLWNTHFLDNLWVDVVDYQFANGVVGKIVVFNMEERQRVKIVDYVGSKKLEQSKIDDKLK